MAKGRLEEGGLAKEVDPEEPMSPGVGAGAGGAGIPPAPPMPAEWATPAERVSSSHQPKSGGSAEPVKDEIETWSISELDKKGKKKKGTLGVGNGAIFFASEADKVSEGFDVTCCVSIAKLIVVIARSDTCSTIPHRYPPHVLGTIFQDPPLPIRDRPRTLAIPLR